MIDSRRSVRWAAKCCVRGCPDDSGSAQWRTNTAVPCWTIGWDVCSFHYWQLDDGQEYTTIGDAESSSDRWILMGDDLVMEPLAVLA